MLTWKGKSDLVEKSDNEIFTDIERIKRQVEKTSDMCLCVYIYSTPSYHTPHTKFSSTHIPDFYNDAP